MGKEPCFMSDFNNNSDNQEFIKKLELLRDLEAEKPVEEMDVSLVKACVELILELRGETVNFTPEEVEEKVRKIPFVEETTTLNTPPKSVKGRSTKVKSRKILLIAAIISVLIAIFTISSIAFDWNIFDELKNRFGTVDEVPVNQEIEAGGITVIVRGKNEKYNSAEEFFNKGNFKILFPTKLPRDTVVQKITLSQIGSKDEVTFTFSDTNLIYSITFNEIIPDNIKNGSTEILIINGYTCYVTDLTDIGITQIHFECNNNLYYFSYNNKQDLIGIIENLKELK